MEARRRRPQTGADPNPLGFLADEIEELKRQNLYRPMRVLSSPQAAEVVVDGKELISLSSNNYLGLATHPRLVEAAIAATATSARAPARSGRSPAHDDPRALETSWPSSSTPRRSSRSSRASRPTRASSRSWPARPT
jgi:hypothetical protein